MSKTPVNKRLILTISLIAKKPYDAFAHQGFFLRRQFFCIVPARQSACSLHDRRIAMRHVRPALQHRFQVCSVIFCASTIGSITALFYVYEHMQCRFSACICGSQTYTE